MSTFNQYWEDDGGQRKKNDDLPHSTPVNARVNRYNPMPPLDDPVTFRTRNADEHENNRRHRWHCFWQVMLFLLVLGVLAVAILAFWYPHEDGIPGTGGNASGPCIFDPDDMDTMVCANADDTVTFAHDGTEIGRMYPNGAAQRGLDVLATGPNSFAGGRESTTTAEGAFAFGYSGGGLPDTPPTPAPFTCSANLTLPSPGIHGLRASADGAWTLAWAGGGSIVEASGTGASAQGMADANSYILSTMPGAHSEGCAADGSLMAASNKGAHAEGYAITGSMLEASGLGAHIEGYASDGKCGVASGDGAHSEGYASRAEGEGSHAEGYSTRATGVGGHSEGYAPCEGAPPPMCIFLYQPDPFDDPGYNITIAQPFDGLSSGFASHSEGYATRSTERAAHAEGSESVAQGEASHAEGHCNWAIGLGSHAEGGFIDPYAFRKRFIDCPSTQQHSGNYAVGTGSHAEGVCTEAIRDASHSEGVGTWSDGDGSHAEGFGTEAAGRGAHSEGVETYAAYSGTHAEGYGGVAMGVNSHVEGEDTFTGYEATNAHAEGRGILPGDLDQSDGYIGAHARASHVEGTFSGTRLGAEGSHAGGQGGLAYLPGMWAHGFRSDASSAVPSGDGSARPQAVKYAQYTTTCGGAGPFSDVVPLPVPDAKTSFWAGKLTVMGYGSGAVFFHHQYHVTVVKKAGGWQVISAISVPGHPIIDGTWVTTPSSTVNPFDVTVSGYQTAACVLKVRWAVNWDVWETFIAPAQVPRDVPRVEKEERASNNPRAEPRVPHHVRYRKREKTPGSQAA